MATEQIRYFVPGPAFVRQSIRDRFARPVVPHRSAEFVALYGKLTSGLREVFRTNSDVIIATGSSTLMMEAALVSTTSEQVLNLVNGAFSQRWHEIALSLGRRAERLEMAWGQAIDLDELRQALRRRNYEAVTVVHNETSTGVMNPLEEIAAVVRRESDALLLVDTVSSLGGAPVESDLWELDIVIAGTQKALAMAPGLAVVSLSERAAQRAARIGHRGFYTDLLRYRDRGRKGGPITTPAVSLVYGLAAQIDHILEEGLEKRWERHRRLLDITSAWAERAGFEYASHAATRSWTVSCLRPPAKIAAPDLVDQLAESGYIVGHGYGPWRDETFRIGHMGEVQVGDLEALLGAIDEIVKRATK